VRTKFPIEDFGIPHGSIESGRKNMTHGDAENSHDDILRKIAFSGILRHIVKVFAMITGRYSSPNILIDGPGFDF
jgi:hypothetical protein